MLIARRPNPALRPARQEGVILVIALIMLVSMSLAGVALVRSVYATNIIAGNLAFQQSATNSADGGIETAISWLETNAGSALFLSNTAMGYNAIREDPSTGQSWSAFWTVQQTANKVRTITATDPSGNSISYMIQRMCAGTGDPTSGIGCSIAPTVAVSTSNSKGVLVVGLTSITQIYYRVTVRVSGPRSTTSYVQVMVAI